MSHGHVAMFASMGINNLQSNWRNRQTTNAGLVLRTNPGPISNPASSLRAPSDVQVTKKARKSKHSMLLT